MTPGRDFFAVLRVLWALCGNQKALSQVKDRSSVCIAFALCAAVMPLHAQGEPHMAMSGSPHRCELRPVFMRASWAPPLDRIVTIGKVELPLRDALELVAERAQLQLSYSAERVPTHAVCVAFDRVPVGAALEHLLPGLPLRVIVVGASEIVLAPVRESRSASLDSGFAAQPGMLERVVVTGAPDGMPQRATSHALQVVDRAMLLAHGVTSLGQALELAVPGTWMWSPSPGAMTAQYGSIRGASSFGATAPKVYLDGVEIANPLLVTQIDASTIDRIEVIRGPQGAALYGADAISGVVSIISRFDGATGSAAHVNLSSSAGISQTDYAARSPVVQQHALSMRLGQGPQTAGAGVTLSTVGAYVPGAAELRVLAGVNARRVLSNGTITGTGRVAMQRGDAATTPLVRALEDTSNAQSIAQYTLGGTVTIMPSPMLTFSAVAGVDGFRLRGLSTISLPVPLAIQEPLAELGGGADRLSLRLRGAARRDIADATVMTVTLGAEQAFLRDASEPIAVGNGVGIRRRVLSSPWATNSGVMGQLDLAWRDNVYVVVGGRLEQTVGATPTVQQAAMPMIGVALARDVGVATIKVRGGYGRGIRPAQSFVRGATVAGRAPLTFESELSPESQAGTEFGTDLVLGDRVSFHVTRFDQQATGLVQPVAVTAPPLQRPGGPPNDSIRARRVGYVLENVGAIDNRGWEVEARARWRAFTLGGWWSQVDSRVVRISPSYRGELLVGDRPVEVPAQTASVSVSWNAGRLSASVSAARAMDWIGYDRLRIAYVLSNNDRTEAELTGAHLRRFWKEYDAVTRMRSTVGVRANERLTLTLVGDNLLDVQSGAPDNGTVVLGRTVSVGARLVF